MIQLLIMVHTAGAFSVHLKEFPEEETEFVPEAALVAEMSAAFGEVMSTVTVITFTVTIVVGMSSLCAVFCYGILCAATVITVSSLSAVSETCCVIIRIILSVTVAESRYGFSLLFCPLF